MADFVDRWLFDPTLGKFVAVVIGLLTEVPTAAAQPSHYFVLTFSVSPTAICGGNSSSFLGGMNLHFLLFFFFRFF